MGAPAGSERVRVYDVVRSAHLERFQTLEPADVLYAGRSYDFAPALLEGLDVRSFVGARELFTRVLRGRYRELEINEPLLITGIKWSLVAVLALRLGGLLRRTPTTVVTYAIGNLDTLGAPYRQLRTPVRRRAYRWAATLLAHQVDRMVFGTTMAEETYRPYLRRFRGTTVVLPALPTACEVCPDVTEGHEPDRVVFLGAFAARKGLPQLVAAWPHVAAARPSSQLHVVGQGELQALADELALREDVSVVVDPSRQEIHRVLRGAHVLVLVSQPTQIWREQVGLPIVEALQHGCEVVASTETGLASWLTEHGHRVVELSDAPEELAATILDALASPRSAAEIVADLPLVDGRLEADRWMFSTVT